MLYADKSVIDLLLDNDLTFSFIVNQEQNQKITTIKTADNEDSTTTERTDSSPDSTNLSGT